jgi:hypothetical protein
MTVTVVLLVVAALVPIVALIGMLRMLWRIWHHNEEPQPGGSLGRQMLGDSARKRPS